MAPLDHFVVFVFYMPHCPCRAVFELLDNSALFWIFETVLWAILFHLFETSRKKPVHGLKVYPVDLPINELYEVFALASWSYKSDDNFPFKILPPDWKLDHFTIPVKQIPNWLEGSQNIFWLGTKTYQQQRHLCVIKALLGLLARTYVCKPFSSKVIFSKNCKIWLMNQKSYFMLLEAAWKAVHLTFIVCIAPF